MWGKEVENNCKSEILIEGESGAWETVREDLDKGKYDECFMNLRTLGYNERSSKYIDKPAEVDVLSRIRDPRKTRLNGKYLEIWSVRNSEVNNRESRRINKI